MLPQYFYTFVKIIANDSFQSNFRLLKGSVIDFLNLHHLKPSFVVHATKHIVCFEKSLGLQMASAKPAKKINLLFGNVKIIDPTIFGIAGEIW